MAARIKLSDGDEFIVYITRDELMKKFRDALDENRFLEVTNGDGRVRVVNPHHILYFEDVDAPSPEAMAAAAHERLASSR